jgi:predicted neuraminidase
VNFEAKVKLPFDKFASRMGWMTRVHPLELPSGRVLVPLYSDGYDFSLIAITGDGGINWTTSEPMLSLGGVQPSLVRRKDGTIVAFMRDNGPPPKRVMTSESKDDGASWSPVIDSDIPNPGSSVEAIALKDGSWLMVLNDTEKGRHSLAAWLSDDEGRTWKWKRHLELDNAQTKPGSFSYPSVIQTKDGMIHATYSHSSTAGQSIKHVMFNAEWVRQAPVK